MKGAGEVVATGEWEAAAVVGVGQVVEAEGEVVDAAVVREVTERGRGDAIVLLKRRGTLARQSNPASTAKHMSCNPLDASAHRIYIAFIPFPHCLPSHKPLAYCVLTSESGST